MSGLYLAIIALIAAMLWVIAPPSAMKPSDGVGAALQVYLCLLFLKVVLDDAVHFNDKKKSGANWAHGLGFCILWNLFTLDALRVSAIDIHRSFTYAIFAQIIGTVWIVQNYLHKAPEVNSDEKQRHTGWAYINCLNIAGLTTLNTYVDSAPKEFSAALLIILSVVTLFDFLFFGTLTRVRDAFR